MPTKKYAEAYDAYGACTNCGARPAKANRKCCQHCISKASARAADRTKARRANGCCVVCNAPTPRWLCVSCSAARNLKARSRTEAARLEREVQP